MLLKVLFVLLAHNSQIEKNKLSKNEPSFLDIFCLWFRLFIWNSFFKLFSSILREFVHIFFCLLTNDRCIASREFSRRGNRGNRRNRGSNRSSFPRTLSASDIQTTQYSKIDDGNTNNNTNTNTDNDNDNNMSFESRGGGGILILLTTYKIIYKRWDNKETKDSKKNIIKFVLDVKSPFG
jgi:hypothetical protein